jgi:hypothetical protein
MEQANSSWWGGKGGWGQLTPHPPHHGSEKARREWNIETERGPWKKKIAPRDKTGDDANTKSKFPKPCLELVQLPAPPPPGPPARHCRDGEVVWRQMFDLQSRHPLGIPEDLNPW